ncbi:MAG: cupin domain-containing protein [Solirubrobacterales bacterium]|nr:cupin domain-containing protein [Solirubrobacterales bacterium]
MSSANVFDPAFGDRSERAGFAGRRARIGRQAGAEHLGGSLYELAPGSAPFPMHYHLGNEELLVVIAGEPSLRTPAGERRLAEGEVVAFPAGEGGAHQVVNRGEDPVRVLLVSEMNAPDVVVRPESNKISAFGRAPGAAGEGFHDAYFRRDAVALWEGEAQPPPPPAR